MCRRVTVPIEDADTCPGVPRSTAHIAHASEVHRGAQQVNVMLLTDNEIMCCRAMCGHRDRALRPADCLLPEASSDVLLIAWDNMIHGQRWSHLLQALSTSRSVLRDAECRLCYSQCSREHGTCPAYHCWRAHWCKLGKMSTCSAARSEGLAQHGAAYLHAGYCGRTSTESVSRD